MLTLREVGRHPQGATALQELRRTYDVTEEPSGLVFTQKAGDLRLFLYNMDEVLAAARRSHEARGEVAPHHADERHDAPANPDLQQPDVLQLARQTIVELLDRIAKLQAASKAIVEEREHWKYRAAQAEKGLAQPVSGAGDKRYDALRRFLAKQFHPDHAPGNGIEKMIRGEMFKEIWAQIDRIDATHR